MKALRSGFLVLAFTGALLTSSAALAGWKQALDVEIVDDFRMADGDLAAARNSPDNNQYLGCYNYVNTGVCYAANSSGVARSCVTSDPALLAVIRSLTSNSNLTFEWDASGRCTNVEVNTGSYNGPIT